LAEFGGESLQAAYYRANAFPGRVVADPFMGGGISLLEANRVGCDVIGFDINPMAAWTVCEEIEHIDLGSYQKAASTLLARLLQEIGAHYRTRCQHCHGDVPVK
jgi:adenine-specific DNA methylase